MKLLCRLTGHVRMPYAARKAGRHVTGELCRRCGQILSVQAGSRQERRRIVRAAVTGRGVAR